MKYDVAHDRQVHSTSVQTESLTVVHSLLNKIATKKIGLQVNQYIRFTHISYNLHKSDMQNSDAVSTRLKYVDRVCVL